MTTYDGTLNILQHDEIQKDKLNANMSQKKKEKRKSY